jgi:hypothetical protein
VVLVSIDWFAWLIGGVELLLVQLLLLLVGVEGGVSWQ